MFYTTTENCLMRFKRLLNKLKHSAEQVIFFSDEKNFDQDQKVNKRRRNDKWLYADPSKVTKVMHTKFLATIMVLGLLTMKDMW